MSKIPIWRLNKQTGKYEVMEPRRLYFDLPDPPKRRLTKKMLYGAFMVWACFGFCISMTALVGTIYFIAGLLIYWISGIVLPGMNRV